jgi:poly(A) polymerase
MQPRFRQRQGKRPLRLLGHPRFRAAYDFFCLRAAAGEALQEDCQWWTDLQTMDTEAQHGAVGKARKRPRRRKPASIRANANA